jgi:hypothetical protein
MKETYSEVKEGFCEADYTRSDLVRYAVDHLAAAEKLYEVSDRFTWQYLHSAAFLSHLGIELLLKACLLDLEGTFPDDHNLKRLFEPLRQKGVIELSPQGEAWLNHLSDCHWLGYTNPTSLQVDLNEWKQTEALFEELKMTVPKEIQKLIVEHERYHSSVKSVKPTWPV